VLMVRSPSGHQGPSEVHLPAAMATLQFAPTEALLRSPKGLPGGDLALMAALQPVEVRAQSAQMVLP